MSDFTFPSLDSLRRDGGGKSGSPNHIDWVTQLGKSAEPPAPASAGWSPPTIESVFAPALDIEAERQMAQEEGFRIGYPDGLSAGKEIGLAEGRREGRAEVLAQQQAAIEEFRASLAQVVETIHPAVDRWQSAIEERAADLALSMVKRLLAAELATQRPSALGIVREAMGHAEGAVRATVRLSPFDRAELAEHREEILAACAGMRDLELVDDRSITGGCIVETENGVIDATLETRVSLLEAA